MQTVRIESVYTVDFLQVASVNNPFFCMHNPNASF